MRGLGVISEVSEDVTIDGEGPEGAIRWVVRVDGEAVAAFNRWAHAVLFRDRVLRSPDGRRALSVVEPLT